MIEKIKTVIERSINPSIVHSDGVLTTPRTYGVYALPDTVGTTRRFREGNYPIRMRELEREFGSCKLEFLFHLKADAVLVARHLNQHGKA